MRAVQLEGFGRTVNTKCLVCEPVLFENRLKCCEVRKVGDNDDDSNDEQNI